MVASASPAVNIGNYKGVMLCNRPFNGVSTSLAKEGRSGSGAGNNYSSSGSDNKPAFLAGTPTEPLGMNVPIHSEPLHAIKRDKKHTALSKHKKWLHDLQSERARLQEILIEDEEKRRRRKERFSQREAKFREMVRKNSGPETESSHDAAAAEKKLKRPMWALTKQTAEEKEAFMEDAEADDLIEFANNLDIDQFMDDVEIKARVAQVEQQLAQVQSIVDYEEAEEKRQERDYEREENGSKVVPLNANDLAKLDRLGAKNSNPDDDDVISVASSVLSECKSIRSVHSVRSVAALTKRAEAKLSDCSNNGSPITSPKVVTIDEEEGARMQIKHLPSNLPYIHRNPAI